MSTIKVLVHEQSLRVIEGPKIASKGVNENYVKFVFDSSWTGFGKVAIFYMEEDEGSVYQAVVDSNGLASIPWEVTALDGKLCFGVAGTKDNIIYTSEIIKYNIVEGVPISGSESEPPSSTIYQQMLSLVGQIQSNVASLESDIASIESNTNDRLNAMSSQIDEFVAEHAGTYGETILWDSDNASGETISGNTRTVTLAENCSGYDYIDVHFGSYVRTNTGVDFVNHYQTFFEPDYNNKELSLYKWQFTPASENNPDGIHFKITYNNKDWSWSGNAADSAEGFNVSRNGWPFVKIVGRKLVGDAELGDARIGVDGTVYQTVGAAIRGQINDVASGAVELDTTLTQQGKAADAKIVGDGLSQLQADLGEQADEMSESVDFITNAQTILSSSFVASADNPSSYNRNLFIECEIKSGNYYKINLMFNECHFRNRNNDRVFQMATATQASYNYLVDMFADVNDSFSPEFTSYIFKATGNASHLYMYCYTSLNSAINVSVTVKKVSSLSELGDVYNVIGKSISGVPISFEFDPDYGYSSSAKNIGSYTLDSGTYVLTYRQEEGAEPTNLNTRLTPWFKGVNHGNVFQFPNATNVSREKSDKVWVFNLDSIDTYTFYFWCRFVTMLNAEDELLHISNIQLFKVDNINGRLYKSINDIESKTDIAYSYISQFQRIGCIGDSWTAGSIYQNESTWAGTLKNLSWDKNAERLTGSHFVQYAKGGLSSKTWLTDMNGKDALENDTPCGLYFVFLGINDATELTNSEIILGNVDDFDNNIGGTFYYYYGAVINSIKTYSPNSKIILSTIMIRSAQQVVVRNAIIAYAQANNIPYIDVYEDAFFRNEFMNPINIVGGHPTATGHAGMAQAILRLTARCIFENSNYFKINTMYKNGNFSIESIAGLLGINLITSTAHYKRDANTSHSAATYGIDTIQLNPGKYIFKWSQSAASATGSNSRCTPVMAIDDNKSYYASNQNFPNTVAGNYYWVVTIASKCVATFAFWSQNLSNVFEAWGFDLYDYNSVRGRLDKLNGLVG